MKHQTIGLIFVGCGLTTGFVWLALLFSNSVVTNQYASLSAAQAARIFEHGWLPEILPPSAHSIRTSNNLDLNTSEGEFSFTPVEYSWFFSQLRPYAPIDAPLINWKERSVRRREAGFQIGYYVADKSTWVFFCQISRGYCEYRLVDSD